MDTEQITDAPDDHRDARHDFTERDLVTCGTCRRQWCDVCTPTPSARCPFEYEHIDNEVCRVVTSTFGSQRYCATHGHGGCD